MKNFCAGPAPATWNLSRHHGSRTASRQPARFVADGMRCAAGQRDNGPGRRGLAAHAAVWILCVEGDLPDQKGWRIKGDADYGPLAIFARGN